MNLADILTLPPNEAVIYLLGSTIVSTVGGVETGGVISELEAYLSVDDLAAHGSRGLTNANASLYKEAGTLYIHRMRQWNLMDIVTEVAGVPSSVLVRALIPTIGIPTMRQRRNELNISKFTNGPGKVCQSLGVTKLQDGENILTRDSSIKLRLPTKPVNDAYISCTKRIGIRKNPLAPLRFVLKDEFFEQGSHS